MQSLRFSNLLRKRRFDRWDWFGLGIVGLVLLPIISVGVLSLAEAKSDLSVALPRYFFNSIQLMIGVSLFASIIGISAAWCVVKFNFWGRRVLEWALFFPLAIPAYISAYAFVDFWEFAGPVQTQLRSIFGWQTARDYWFFETRSMGMAIFVIGLSLYPYVYMLARAAFREQSAQAVDVARTLGATPRQQFWRVALPMARPNIAIAIALVMMETLNDFGAVDYFAVQTLTTGIFTTWLEAGDLASAARIAISILTLVAVLVFVERYSRRNARFHQRANDTKAPARKPLTLPNQALAFAICALPVLLGFALPLGVMLEHSLSLETLPRGLLSATLRSIYIASLAATLTVGAAMILSFTIRKNQQGWSRIFAPIATIGYAAPGAMLGIGLLIPLAAFDHRLADWAEMIGIDLGLLLTGSASAMVLAYFVRFFALAFGAVDGAMGRHSPNLGFAARALGASSGRALRKVHMPLIAPSLFVGVLLVFVDTVKELPATLLLRPFGFETLSTLVYNAASREDIEAASLSALLVILVGLIAVAIIAHSTRDQAS